ncbi:hypothetical protein CFN78_22345 [Amycolatopsis antarctica]|uniref:Peptidase n=2 Tax=Amycolatopsis antarctica TaxID=1854586 RepID=A0A263CY00_9PSEU|nr:hypothetical protein CFN78_22345 [Amycolatopsis antarctica]
MAEALPADARFNGQGTRHGTEVTPTKRSAAAVGDAVRANPNPKLGKVFFTLGGSNYVCSGTATRSANADVVTTAGHCLNEGPGAFATNFAFVPAYDNGSRPYGTWTAKRLLTTSGWANTGDFNVDVGFAVMNTDSSGRSLTQVTGAQDIAFNLARGLSYESFGYPAASPYNGQLLWKCADRAGDDQVGGSNDLSIRCSMTGGSSGGGWITGGRLNSVNSFGYTTQPNVMYGPYFGSTIQSVYNQAQNA